MVRIGTIIIRQEQQSSYLISIKWELLEAFLIIMGKIKSIALFLIFQKQQVEYLLIL